jgi:diadenosine tetraphosphatase ApaH/serine/threonine PP2A family protein phosphatase
MRTAFFADVHSNREALTACLGHACTQDIDRLVYLGDLVGYGADPKWVIATVRAHCAQGALAVQGNHDAAVVDPGHRRMHDEAERAIDWTRDRLDADQLRFLAELPLTVEAEENLFVHANGWAPAQWYYITNPWDATRSMASTFCRRTFCGHMHDPMLYSVRLGSLPEQIRPEPGASYPLHPQRQWLAIAGSVGQPRDGDPRASYAVLDDRSNTLTYFRIAYDAHSAANKIRTVGLPEEFARRLEAGSHAVAK